MKGIIKEESELLLSLLKWLILATIVGILTGITTVLFLKTINITTDFIYSYQYYFLLLPIALFLSSFVIRTIAPNADVQGKVLQSVHKENGVIKLNIVPARFIATVLTIAGGGSVGKVGPCAQMGAGMASGVADFIKISKDDRKKLLVCGISAGFSTVFGTPLAGALFAVEVLVLGRVLNNYLLPVFISSMVGYKVAGFLGMTYHQYNISVTTEQNMIFYIKIGLSGIFFGVIALMLIELLKLGTSLASNINIYKPLKGLIGGVFLIILALLLSTEYLGLGQNIINHALSGHDVSKGAFLIKIFFVVITLTFGGSGGVLTPIFFIGATAGVAYAEVFNLNSSVIAAIGLVALLAAATNTPIASTVMALELFGSEVLVYAAIASIISFFIAGNRSIYPSQIIEDTNTKGKSLVLPHQPIQYEEI